MSISSVSPEASCEGYNGNGGADSSGCDDGGGSVTGRRTGDDTGNGGGDCLVADPFGFTLGVSWPVDPTVTREPYRFVCGVEFTAVELLLKTQDYCLIRRFLDHNIAAPPRSLLPAITSTSTEQAAVNYGYEERDGPPTTYCVGVKLDAFSVSLCEESWPTAGAAVGLTCNQFQWQLRRAADVVSEQEILCQSNGIATSIQTIDNRYSTFSNFAHCDSRRNDFPGE